LKDGELSGQKEKVRDTKKKAKKEKEEFIIK